MADPIPMTGMGDVNAQYNLWSAEQDTTIAALAKATGAKTGWNEQLVSQLITALTSLLGYQNKAVGMGLNVRGSVQQYGMPGYGLNAQPGFIGGHDVATYAASMAVQQAINQRFVDPRSGAPTAAAHGLDQQMLGQAFRLAMQTGAQYGAGGLFNQAVVTDDYKRRLLEEGRKRFTTYGDRSILDEASNLTVGGIHTKLSDTGRTRIQKMVEDTAQTLGSIKEIMGSQAITDLDNTLSKLFGGDLTKFGHTAARLRMMEIKGMSSYYGNAQTAAAALAATSDMVGAGLAPNMGASEARVRFGSLTSHAAAFAERMSQAGGMAEVRNRAVLQGAGYSGVTTSHQDRSMTIGEGIGRVINEERQLTALAHFAENGLPAEHKAEAERLAKNLEQATDPQSRRRAQQDINRFMSARAGRSAESYLDYFGGVDNVRQNLGAYGNQMVAGTSARAYQNRVGARIGDVMANDTTLKNLGYSAAERRLAGAAGGNLSAGHLEEINAYMKQNPGAAAEAILGRLQSIAGVGDALRDSNIDIGAVARLLESKGDASGLIRSKAVIEQTKKGFVGAADRAYRDQDTLRRTLENWGHSTKRVGLLSDFVEGFTGMRTRNDDELLNWLAGTGKVKNFDMKDGVIEASKDNFGKLFSILGDEGLAAAGFKSGMDPEDFIRRNGLALSRELGDRGAVSAVGGVGRWASNEDKEIARRGYQALDYTRLAARYGTSSFKARDGESAEDAEKRFVREMNKSFSAEGFENQLMRLGNADIRKGLVEQLGLLSPENREEALDAAYSARERYKDTYRSAEEQYRKYTDPRGTFKKWQETDPEGFEKAKSQARNQLGQAQANTARLEDIFKRLGVSPPGDSNVSNMTVTKMTVLNSDSKTNI